MKCWNSVSNHELQVVMGRSVSIPMCLSVSLAAVRSVDSNILKSILLRHVCIRRQTEEQQDSPDWQHKKPVVFANCNRQDPEKCKYDSESN